MYDIDADDTFEHYSSFPKGTNDDDVYDMLVLGELKAVCCKCCNIDVVSPEEDLYKCSKCKQEQAIPTMNPDEVFKYED